MTEAVGLQPEQMLDLSRRFATAADALQRADQNIQRAVNAAWWVGPVAIKFRASWTSSLEPRLRSGVATLRMESKTLLAQRIQQIEASNSGFDLPAGARGEQIAIIATGMFLENAKFIFDHLTPNQYEALTSDQRKIVDLYRSANQLNLARFDGGRLDSAFANALKLPPEAQLAWWNSLTPDEQAVLKRNHRLYALKGIPKDVADVTLKRELEKLKLTVPTKEREDSLRGEVNGGFHIYRASISAELDMVRRQYSDGRVAVDVGARGDVTLGLEKKAHGIGAELNRTQGGGVVKTFDFSNSTDADAFIASLYAKPTKFKDTFRSYSEADMKRVDQMFVETVVTGKLVIGDSELAIDGAFKIEQELGGRFDRTYTLSQSIKAEAAIDVGVLAISASGKVEASLAFQTDGSNNPKEVSATFSIEATAGAELEAKLRQLFPGNHMGAFKISGSAEVGFRAEVNMKWDLTDEDVISQLGPVALRMKSGEVSLADFGQIARYATATVQIQSVSEASFEAGGRVGIDGGYVGAKLETSTHNQILEHLYIKPTGMNDLYQVK
jgi:hypothetical protein